jgi:trehalose/maltose hydrolase-like predicted phosphorylase
MVILFPDRRKLLLLAVLLFTAAWSSMDYRVSFRGQDYRVEATHGEVKVTAPPDNTAAARLEVGGQAVADRGGTSETVRW